MVDAARGAPAASHYGPMSDQQWPTVPSSPEAPSDAFLNPAEAQFCVLVEEIVGSGESARWGLGETRSLRTTRADARATALDMARTFSPRHPMFEQARDVYRVNEDEYIVLVQGATSTFHFRVCVAELI